MNAETESQSTSRPDHPPEASAAPPRISLAGLLDAAGMLACSASFLALAGPLHWTLELTTHFRFHYVLCLACCLVSTVLRRRRTISAVFVLGLLPNLIVLGEAGLTQQVPTVRSGPGVKIASVNVLSSNQRQEPLLRWLASQDPDVIALMEVNAAWANALAPLGGRYPHQVVQPRNDNFGIACFSRLEMRERQVLEFGPSGLPSIFLSLELEGRAVSLLATHPLPPLSARHAFSRDQQLTELGLWLVNRPEPAILVGDFNTTPWAPGFRALLRKTGLRDTLAGRGWQPTWPSRFSGLGIPIDHCLVSRHWAVAERTIGPGIGGDHRPLLIDLRLPDGLEKGQSERTP